MKLVTRLAISGLGLLMLGVGVGSEGFFKCSNSKPVVSFNAYLVCDGGKNPVSVHKVGDTWKTYHDYFLDCGKDGNRGYFVTLEKEK